MGEEMKYKSSVKVMRSYDYCHFEVQLGSDNNLTLEQVDNMRKEAARLADKAVSQYVVARKQVDKTIDPEVSKKAQAILENIPASEWTPDHQAIIKRDKDQKFYASRKYDYEDDWDDYPGGR